MQWFAGHYLEDVRHGADWRVSPLRAQSHAGLAPAVVCTAWFDPLRDEGKAYAEALRAAGVDPKYHPGAGLIHGYFGLGEATETARYEAQRARADFKAMLQRVRSIRRQNDLATASMPSRKASGYQEAPAGSGRCCMCRTQSPEFEPQ